MYDDGNLAVHEFAQLIKLIESTHSSVPLLDSTVGMNKTLANLFWAIDPAEPLVSVQAMLAQAANTQRFPNDQEFSVALVTRDIYGWK